MPKPATVIESKVEPNPALEKRTRRVFTADYKLSILQQADACQHGELGDLLRREKLYSNQLAQWRREFADQGVAGLAKSAPGPASTKNPDHQPWVSSSVCSSSLILVLRAQTSCACWILSDSIRLTARACIDL